MVSSVKSACPAFSSGRYFLTQVMLVTCNGPAMHVVIQHVASLSSSGRTTVIVMCSRKSSRSISPVSDAYAFRSNRVVWPSRQPELGVLKADRTSVHCQPPPCVRTAALSSARRSERNTFDCFEELMLVFSVVSACSAYAVCSGVKLSFWTLFLEGFLFRHYCRFMAILKESVRRPVKAPVDSTLPDRRRYFTLDGWYIPRHLVLFPRAQHHVAMQTARSLSYSRHHTGIIRYSENGDTLLVVTDRPTMYVVIQTVFSLPVSTSLLSCHPGLYFPDD